MATTIRIRDEDLGRFNRFIGELQSTGDRNVTQADGFRSLLNQLAAYSEMLERINELLDCHPTFSVGDDWELALYAALGSFRDIAWDVGREEFEAWVEEMGDTKLASQVKDRMEGFDWDEVEGE